MKGKEIDGIEPDRKKAHMGEGYEVEKSLIFRCLDRCFFILPRGRLYTGRGRIRRCHASEVIEDISC